MQTPVVFCATVKAHCRLNAGCGSSTEPKTYCRSPIITADTFVLHFCFLHLIFKVGGQYWQNRWAESSSIRHCLCVINLFEQALLLLIFKLVFGIGIYWVSGKNGIGTNYLRVIEFLFCVTAAQFVVILTISWK